MASILLILIDSEQDLRSHWLVLLLQLYQAMRVNLMSRSWRAWNAKLRYSLGSLS